MADSLSYSENLVDFSLRPSFYVFQVVRALDCEGEASDLSNGVKYGQSTVYDSGQYSEDIMRFRRMALGSVESSEYDMYSGEFNSREVSGPQNQWKDGSSGESESRAFTRVSGEQGFSGPEQCWEPPALNIL